MARFRYYLNWLFRDLTERRGKYVIAEVPNLPLVIFMIAIVITVVLYPGFWQKAFAIIAYVALAYWGWQEYRGGRSRFRKLLGILGLIAVVGALVLMFVK